MDSMVNVPTKKGKQKITCVADEGCFHVQTSDGWTICKISRSSDKATASDIADAIRLARDTGYEHALRHVRRQLGIIDR